jgi:hypothetical protein
MPHTYAHKLSVDKRKIAMHFRLPYNSLLRGMAVISATVWPCLPNSIHTKSQTAQLRDLQNWNFFFDA